MSDTLLPQYADTRGCPFCKSLLERIGGWRYDRSRGVDTWAPEPMDAYGERYTHSCTCWDCEGGHYATMPRHMTTVYDGEIPSWAYYMPPSDADDMVGDMLADMAARRRANAWDSPTRMMDEAQGKAGFINEQASEPSEGSI